MPLNIIQACFPSLPGFQITLSVTSSLELWSVVIVQWPSTVTLVSRRLRKFSFTFSPYISHDFIHISLFLVLGMLFIFPDHHYVSLAFLIPTHGPLTRLSSASSPQVNTSPFLLLFLRFFQYFKVCYVVQFCFYLYTQFKSLISNIIMPNLVKKCGFRTLMMNTVMQFETSVIKRKMLLLATLVLLFITRIRFPPGTPFNHDNQCSQCNEISIDTVNEPNMANQ